MQQKAEQNFLSKIALILVIPHTTAVRHNPWEFTCAKPFLKPGVFHLQQIQL
jgi:hypothetical protein